MKKDKNYNEHIGCAWMILAFFLGIALCVWASKQ